MPVASRQPLDASSGRTRAVAIGDGPALAELFGAIDDSHFQPHPMTAAEAERISRYRGKDLYAVVEAGGQFVAYGMLRGWDEGFEVPSLGIAVRVDRQRNGHGRTLMAWLAKEARRRHASRIRLRVHADNAPARRLYESLGYEYAGNERGELLMLLSLNR